MDYAYLFSGMGVTIIYLALKVVRLTNSRDHYKQVISGIGLGKYKVKVEVEGDLVHTEIVEVKK